MTNKNKPAQQELFANVAHHIDETEVFRGLIFGDKDPAMRMRERYRVWVPELGKREVVRVLDGDVIAPVDIEAVAVSIQQWTHYVLTSQHQAYRWICDTNLRCAKNWRYLSRSLITDEDIKPVRTKSETGFCLRKLDVDPQEMPTPTYDALCSHITSNKDALEAFCGATIFSDKTLQQYVWLYGQGKDGKGTLFRFLEKILGPSYEALPDNPKLHNQFFSYRLVGKRLGAFADAQSTDFIKQSFFMQATGGDAIAVEPKGRSGYTTKLRVHFFIGSNKHPEITRSVADMRRIILVEFRRREDTDPDIPHFEKKLWEERAGILHKWQKAWEEHQTVLGDAVKVDLTSAKLTADIGNAGWEQIFEEYFELATDDHFVTGTEMQKLWREKQFKRDGLLIKEFQKWLKDIHRISYQAPRKTDNTTAKTIFKGLKCTAPGIERDSGINTENIAF